MVKRLTGNTLVPGIYPQRPGQVGRTPVELLVEPVPEPPDRLGQDQARGNGVGEQAEADPSPPAGKPGAQRPTGDPAPDPQPTVPDPQHVDRVSVGAEVGVRARDDVVDPRPDDAERNSPSGHVGGDIGRLAARAQPLPGDHDRDRDADQDHKGVGPQRDGTCVQDARRGAGNRG